MKSLSLNTQHWLVLNKDILSLKNNPPKNNNTILFGGSRGAGKWHLYQVRDKGIHDEASSGILDQVKNFVVPFSSEVLGVQHCCQEQWNESECQTFSLVWDFLKYSLGKCGGKQHYDLTQGNSLDSLLQDRWVDRGQYHHCAAFWVLLSKFYCVAENVPCGFLRFSKRDYKKPLLNLRGLFQTMKMLLKKCNILVIVETVRQGRNVKYIFIRGLRHPHSELW